TSVFTLILFLTTIILGGLGGADDYLKLKYKNSKGVSRKVKMISQGLLGALIALYLLVPGVSESLSRGTWFQPPVVKEYLKSAKKTAEEQTQPSSSYKTLSMQEYATRIYIPFFKEHLFAFSGLFGVLALLFIIGVISGSSNAVNLTDGLDGLAAGCL